MWWLWWWWPLQAAVRRVRGAESDAVGQGQGGRGLRRYVLGILTLTLTPTLTQPQLQPQPYLFAQQDGGRVEYVHPNPQNNLSPG